MIKKRKTSRRFYETGEDVAMLDERSYEDHMFSHDEDEIRDDKTCDRHVDGA
jgi:hypothetical protein